MEKKVNPEVLSSEEKKLLGRWRYISPGITMGIYTNLAKHYIHEFYDNGTFMYTQIGSHVKTGNYKAKGGKITFTNISWTGYSSTTEKVETIKHPDTVVEYQFEKIGIENYLRMPNLEYPQKNYLSNKDHGIQWRFS